MNGHRLTYRVLADALVTMADENQSKLKSTETSTTPSFGQPKGLSLLYASASTMAFSCLSNQVSGETLEVPGEGNCRQKLADSIRRKCRV